MSRGVGLTLIAIELSLMASGAAGAAPPATPSASASALTASLDRVNLGLDAYWRSLLGSARIELVQPYTAPVVRAYESGTIPDSSCAKGFGLEWWLQNARYCSPEQMVWYDDGWLSELAVRFGSYAPEAILSHEWGHHLQRLLGWPDTSMAMELQADCYAGMYFASTEGTTSDGTEYVLRGDELLAALTTFFRLGDAGYEASRWFQPDLHGSAQERFLAFATGYTTGSGSINSFGRVADGFAWCLGYGDFQPGGYVSIGDYQLLAPPGRPGLWEGNVYLLPARQGPFPESDLRVTWIPGGQASGAPGSADLETALAEVLPGSRLIIEPMDSTVGPDPAVSAYFERAADGEVVSGYVQLLASSTGTGSLLIIASRPEPSPDPSVLDASSMALLAEQILSVGVITGRLCGPTESGDPLATPFDAACQEHLQ